MPRLSPGGYGVVGGLDAEVWVQTAEGQVPTVPQALRGVRAGGWDWLSADPLMIAGPGAFSAVWTVRGVALETNITVELDPTPNDANWFGAGGGRFASAGTHPLEVRAGALPVPSPLTHYAGAGFYTMSRDALLVIKPNYDAPSGVRVMDGDQRIYDDPSAEFLACNDGLLITREGPDLVCLDFTDGRLRRMPEAEALGQLWRVCRWQGVPHCLTWQPPFNRLVTHAFGSSMGWIISGDAHDFNPDCAANAVRLRVVSSAGQGERPDELRSYTFTADQPQTDLRIGPTPPLPPLTDVPLLNRPFACLLYAEHDAPVPAPAITIPVRGTIIPAGWVCPEPTAPVPARLWAIMAGESDGVSCERRIKDARPIGNRLGRSLVAYQDDSGPLRPSVIALLEHGDVPSFHCYRQPGEPLAVYKSRTADAFRLAPYIAPTIRISNGALSTQETVEAFVVATQLAAEQGWFSACIFGWGRGDTPSEVIPYVERFLSGIPQTWPPRVKPTTLDFATGVRMDVIHGYLKTLDGRYCGVDPAKPDTVYRDRTQGGAWEQVHFTPSAAMPGTWNATFVSAKRACAQTPDATLETRPVGTDGAFEQWTIAKMPPDLAVIPAFVEYAIGEFGATRPVPEVLFVEKTA